MMLVDIARLPPALASCWSVCWSRLAFGAVADGGFFRLLNNQLMPVQPYPPQSCVALAIPKQDAQCSSRPDGRGAPPPRFELMRAIREQRVADSARGGGRRCLEVDCLFASLQVLLGQIAAPAIFWPCLHLCASPIGMGGRSRLSGQQTWSNRRPSPRARRRSHTQSPWIRTGSRSATSSVSAHRPSSMRGRPFGGGQTVHMRRAN